MQVNAANQPPTNGSTFALTVTQKVDNGATSASKVSHRAHVRSSMKIVGIDKAQNSRGLGDRKALGTWAVPGK